MIDFRTSSPDRYKILKAFARENRKNMTEAESVLWQFIRDRRLGVQFLRQHIVGDYIVDFICRDTGLVIEVDGAYHSEPHQREGDERRTRELEAKGLRIVRFSNEDVICDIENVINKICHLL
jgi:very-short-patch-repair endonuclease